MAPEDSDVRNPRRVVGQAAAIITIIYFKIRALNKNTNIPIIVVAVVCAKMHLPAKNQTLRLKLNVLWAAAAENGHSGIVVLKYPSWGEEGSAEEPTATASSGIGTTWS